jgi:cellulose synthase/poly-beta-1,6-N-acetylglucosamine synthase-like glycosyltransferase
MMAEVVFGVAVALIAFAYVGYPVVTFILSRLYRQGVRRVAFLPRVSLIIAAHNEEKDIGAKLTDALRLDYPREKLEIIVASDCSTDGTDEIVRGFARRGVILHRQEERGGKTRAQSRAVSVSSGEILIFSDATTMYEPDAIRKIVRNFADPGVGCVAGQLVYVDNKASAVGAGCRSYWSYEKMLKMWESSFGSLIGVSGCMYAVRRSCHARLASDMIDDFVIATEIHLQGLRTVYEPEAISKEDTNHRAKDEWRMRVRVIEQTMSVLYRYRETLNLRRHSLFAFQLLGHKVLRYLVPVWLLVAFGSSYFAWRAGGSVSFKYIFLAQLAIYVAALCGWVGEKLNLKLPVVAIPYYFALVNLATVAAFIKFMRGEHNVVWEPAREKEKGRRGEGEKGRWGDGEKRMNRMDRASGMNGASEAQPQVEEEEESFSHSGAA